MKYINIKMVASLALAVLLVAMWFFRNEAGINKPPIVLPSVPLEENERFRLHGPKNLRQESVLGTPISEWKIGTVEFPFAGKVSAPSRTEKVRFPRADGSDAEIDVEVFYGESGQPVRFEHTARKDWKRMWTKSDYEMVMRTSGERFFGFSKELLPKNESWVVILGYLRGRINFETSIHFDATWMDFEFAAVRNSWYIINDFGDPSECPPDRPEADKQRIKIVPGEGLIRMDSEL